MPDHKARYRQPADFPLLKFSHHHLDAYGTDRKELIFLFSACVLPPITYGAVGRHQPCEYPAPCDHAAGPEAAGS